MEFLEKFLSKLNRYNDFSNEKMPYLTCITHLNMEISEDEVLNTKVAHIKIDDQFPSKANNKKAKKKINFVNFFYNSKQWLSNLMVPRC